MKIGRKTGLLIVDLQIGFNPSDKIIERIQQAAESYEHVVMTRFFNKPNSLYRSVLGWHGDGGALAFRASHAVIVDKTGYGLTEQHLQMLNKTHCDEWHVCGLETDACVLACAFSLWDAGLRPVILPDLCESPLHTHGLTIAQRQFG